MRPISKKVTIASEAELYTTIRHNAQGSVCKGVKDTVNGGGW